MAKYRIVKKWSNEYEQFFFNVERSELLGWWCLSSNSTIDRAEDFLLKLKNKKEIEPEVLKQYEF